MSYEMLDTKAVEQKEQEPKILLYRGISKKYEGEIGHWWSTNPYYAFKYAEGGKGEMYFVKILESDLKKDASDVSLESNYENYFFKKDPSNARKVTQKELDTLESNTTFTKAGPGGLMMKTPENAVEIGKTIFDKDN